MSDAPKDTGEVPSLLRRFAAAAERAYTAMAVSDIQSQHTAVDRMDVVVKALDGIPPEGRGALTALFDHPHPNVRAHAATYLSDLMPERVLPVLRAVYDSDAGNARMVAGTTIFCIERGISCLKPGPLSESARQKE
jgi:hypothetical protein